MIKENIEKLISISKEKNQLLLQMKGLADKQEDRIEGEKIEDLNETLDKNDSIINKINELDILFLTIFSQIKKEKSIQDIEELDVNEYPELRELKKTIKEVSSTLMTISLMNRENSKAMKHKLEETKAEIRKIRDGKKAYRGYNTKILDSILIDEKK